MQNNHQVIDIVTNTSTVLTEPVTYKIVTAGVGLPDVVYGQSQEIINKQDLYARISTAVPFPNSNYVFISHRLAYISHNVYTSAAPVSPSLHILLRTSTNCRWGIIKDLYYRWGINVLFLKSTILTALYWHWRMKYLKRFSKAFLSSSNNDYLSYYLSLIFSFWIDPFLVSPFFSFLIHPSFLF